MSDDRKHPDYENESFPPAKTISDLYDAPAAIGLLNALFPRDQVDVVHTLTGIPVRSITRYQSGKQRIPPTLMAKLKEQRRLQREFTDDLRALLHRHAESGALHEVLRQAVIVELSSDFFKNDESL